MSSGEVLGGMPVIAGTRIPAETIAIYLRDGHDEDRIREDYPSLPNGADRAVRQWAIATFGADWMRHVGVDRHRAESN